MRKTFFSKKTNHSKGFTLVELSIVGSMMGLLLLIGIIGLRNELSRGEIEETKGNITSVKQTIGLYQKEWKAYPCPADATLLPSNPNFGEEDCSLAGTVLTGSIPAKTLGLPMSLMYDTRGNLLTYAVTRTLTNAVPNPSAGTGAITVKDLNNHDISTDAHYVVLSAGQNEYGAYNKTGNQIEYSATQCANLAEEIENCDGDSVFIQAMTPVHNAASYFDDVVAVGLAADAVEEERDHAYVIIPAGSSCPSGFNSIATYDEYAGPSQENSVTVDAIGAGSGCINAVTVTCDNTRALGVPLSSVCDPNPIPAASPGPWPIGVRLTFLYVNNSLTSPGRISAKCWATRDINCRCEDAGGNNVGSPPCTAPDTEVCDSETYCGKSCGFTADIQNDCEPTSYHKKCTYPPVKVNQNPPGEIVASYDRATFTYQICESTNYGP